MGWKDRARTDEVLEILIIYKDTIIWCLNYKGTIIAKDTNNSIIHHSSGPIFRKQTVDKSQIHC